VSARELMREVYRRNRVLASVGWLHVALLVLFAVFALFDGRMVTGVNPWLKPAKFAVSIAVYTFTLAWLMPYLAHYRRTVAFIAWGTGLVFVGEMACIISQAARGVPSHFNVSTAYDAGVFGLMGMLIAFNTALVLVTLLLFCGRTPAATLAPAYLWGIRLGLLLFLLASLEGFAMVGNMAHTVGERDGGAGLPFVNWSTRAGDLRVAHFLGFHALQILPLAGYSFARWHAPVVRRRAVAFVVALGLVYLAAFTLLFWQASAGRPLLAWN
jgi:hypothetical protein